MRIDTRGWGMGLGPVTRGRLRTQLRDNAAYAVAAALIAALAAGLASYLAVGLTLGVRAALGDRTGLDAVRIFQMRLESADQVTAGDRVLTQLRSGATVDRALRSTPQESAVGEVVVGAQSESDPSDISLIDGRPPTRPGEVIARVDPGQQTPPLGPGSTLAVAGVELEITGTWRPDDPTDPRWTADGALDEGALLLLGPPETLELLDTTPVLRWTVSVDTTPDGITSGDLRSLAARIDDTEETLREEVAVTGLVDEGRLIETLSEVRTVVAAVRPLLPVAFVLVAVGCVLVLGQLARLLGARRVPELMLVRARGASLPQVAVATALETAAVVGPAAIVGGALGVMVTRSLPDASQTPLALTTPVAAILAVATTGVLIAVATTVTASARALGRTTDETTGRRSASIIRIGAIGLLLLAAFIATVRLRNRASAGAADGDPFLSVAPALAVVLVSVAVGLLLAWFASWLAQLLARRSRGLTSVLAVRQVARRTPLLVAPAVALTLAASSAVLAAGYTGTVREAQIVDGELLVGPDLRVAPAYDRPPSPTSYAAVPRSASPVLSSPLDVGEVDDVTLLAGPPRAGFTASAGPTATVGLPADGGPITFTLQALVARPTGSRPLDGAIIATLWLADADGRLRRVSAPAITVPLGQPTTERVEIPWPEGAEEAELAAVDLAVRSPAIEPSTVAVSITDLAFDGRPLATTGDWSAIDFGAGAVTRTEGIGYVAPLNRSAGSTLRRLVPQSLPAEPVPVVVDRALADRLDLDEGSSFEGTLSGTPTVVSAVVAGVAEVLTGAGPGPALTIDLATMSALMLHSRAEPLDVNERWLNLPGATPTQIAERAEELRRGLGTDLTVQTSSIAVPSRLIAPAGDAFVAGAAGAGLLAALAFMAAASAMTDLRARELPILRGMGIRARTQGWGRFVEFALVAAVAVITGLVGGLVAAALLATALSRTVVRELPARAFPEPALDLPLVGLIIGGSTILVLAASAAYAVSTARRAASVDSRGGGR